MKIKVIHMITKLELGGAQQNTIFTVANLNREIFHPVLWSGPGGILTDYASKDFGEDFKLVPHLFREVNPKNDLLALLELRQMLKQEKAREPDAPIVVHTHSSKAGILGRIAARLTHVPIIVHTFHGFGFNDFQPRPVQAAYILAEKITGGMTHGLVFVSRTNMERAKDLKIGREDRYRLIRSGIDLSEFKPKSIDRRSKRREMGVAEDGKVVTMVACFKPQKNPVDFIRMAGLVLKQVPDAWFVVAGDGELRPEMEAAISQYGLKDRVRLLGWRKDVPEILWASDLLVLTSLWEGLPRVFPQAMSAGLAVVGTKVDGGPEAVIDGQNGYLVPPRDFEAIARRVVELLKDDARRESMGKRGSEMAAEWDIHKMVRDQEELYQKLLKEKGLWN
jgi:glycosyltransferase involved in cell wall biosynthesis